LKKPSFFRTDFFTELDPQIRLLPLPNFGVNRRQATGPGWAQAGRPGPFQGPVASPFDLAAIRAIYSPGVESHTSIHSSSATEEQRRGGHRLGEERVELVD
jgi:hypothetical protein